MDEYPEIIADTLEEAERIAIKELCRELSSVLKEMEDHQIKVLALQAQSQFIQMSIQELLEGRRLARLSKEKSI